MSESKGQVEKLLAELGKKIDDLVDEMNDAKDDFRDEFEKQIDDLKERKEKLQDEFEEFKSQEKWHEARGHFVAAVDELKKAVSKAFSRN